MLVRGLTVGALCAALAGCAVVMPAVPLAFQPGQSQSVINLKTVESTVDLSLQDTVSISFVPPRAMSVDLIEYRLDGRVVARDEYDLVLQTAKLQPGIHVVSLFVKSDVAEVRGDTALTIIASGKVPGPSGDSPAEPAESASGAEQRASPNGASQGGASANKGAATPKWTGGNTEEKANVAIRIRLPDD